MKRMATLVLLILAVMGSAFGQTKASKAEPEVLQVEQARVRAVTQPDAAALERLLADDLSYVHSNAWAQTKKEFLASIQSGELAYLAMDHSDVAVRVHGDAAVLTGRSAVRVQTPRGSGKIRSLDIRFTTVYVKQGGRWRQVAWQSTRVAQP